MTRVIITEGSHPRLAPHIKLRRDETRDTWIILAPERVFTPDAIAVAVLQMCDGQRPVAGIALELANRYEADVSRISEDVIAMLQNLADKGVVEA